MPESKRPLNVFLCYDHRDRETILKLHARLTQHGIHAWLDSEDLQPGQDWQHEIRKAILKSDVILVCLSRRFNEQRGFRHEELKIAVEKANVLDQGQIFIIPVRLEECDMPETLSRLHRVDLFEPNGYRKLIRALKKLQSSG
jgi:hypothetical protein